MQKISIHQLPKPYFSFSNFSLSASMSQDFFMTPVREDVTSKRADLSAITADSTSTRFALEFPAQICCWLLSSTTIP